MFKKLNEILFPWIKCNYDICIKNITDNVEKIRKNDLFIINKDIISNKLIDIAIKKKVSVIILNTNNKLFHGKIKLKNKIPIIYFNNLKKYTSYIASNFYDNPGKNLSIIGVTGTNGKTTISNILSQLAEFLGERSSIIGTMGNGLLNNLIKTLNTTDSAIDIQKFLKYLENKSSTFLSIEISSHGIDQYRVSSLKFKAVIFTNLSHDHLDYHENMSNYENTKWSLFKNYTINNYIINIDDKIGYKWFKKLPNAIAVTLNKNINKKIKYYIKINKIIYNLNNTYVSFNSHWGNGEFLTNFIGDFNITNIMLSLATMLSLNYPLKKLLEAIKYLKPIKGRMEIFYKKNNPTIIIDYAHNPDSFSKILKFTRNYCKKKLYCIFGCGGNRDKYKRPIMGKIAEKLSDKIILTSDNPRYENIEKIISEIIFGIKNKNKVIIFNNRKLAIVNTFYKCKKDDVILIIGKGHEEYQLINKLFLYHSDREIAANLLGINL